MTNKLPVVGRRYKLRNQLGSGNGDIVMVVSVEKDFSCKVYFEKFDRVADQPLSLASFCNICEELPEDNLHKPVDFESKEVNEELVREALVKGISQMKQFNERMDRQYPNSIDKAGEWVKCPYSPATPKFNKWFKKIFNCCPITGKKLEEVNEVLNPADLKKEEVNQVERALEKLKLKLHEFEGDHSGWCESQYHYDLFGSITNLINALDNQKNSYQLKPEPKTDIKEERVEPVMIVM